MKNLLLASLIMLVFTHPSSATERIQSLNEAGEKMNLSDDEQNFFEVGGAITLESNPSPMTSNGYATALVDINITPNEQLAFHLELLQSKNFEIDEAFVTWHILPDEKLNLSAGRQYIPFGSLDSAMISSPLTEIIGSIRSDKALGINASYKKLDATAYIFESSSYANDRKNNALDYSFNVGYENEKKSIAVYYISNLASSDQFSSEIIDIDIPGIALSSSISLSPSVDLTLEHIRTIKSLKNGNFGGEITQRVYPSASQIEVEIDLKHSRTLALAWNKTSGTQELIEDNIRKYIGVTYSQPLNKTLSAAVELARYTHANNEKSHSVNLQVVFSF